MNQICRWFTGRYGSRPGFALTCWYQFQNRIIVAEVVARLLGVGSVSCGIDTIHGAAANGQAIRATALKSIDLRTHKITPLQSLNFKNRWPADCDGTLACQTSGTTVGDGMQVFAAGFVGHGATLPYT